MIYKHSRAQTHVLINVNHTQLIIIRKRTETQTYPHVHANITSDHTKFEDQIIYQPLTVDHDFGKIPKCKHTRHPHTMGAIHYDAKLTKIQTLILHTGKKWNTVKHALSPRAPDSHSFRTRLYRQTICKSEIGLAKSTPEVRVSTLINDKGHAVGVTETRAHHGIECHVHNGRMLGRQAAETAVCCLCHSCCNCSLCARARRKPIVWKNITWKEIKYCETFMESEGTRQPQFLDQITHANHIRNSNIGLATSTPRSWSDYTSILIGNMPEWMKREHNMESGATFATVLCTCTGDWQL